ncbi:MAG: D-2-hydroxyacid dehydrogenase family protein [Rhodobiaceae bacterium]|nr:D-2-hydroxyacid dehydrogenase family protein [Rhodobiaceae bacterium]
MAVIDDWQDVARTCTDWSGLETRADIRFYQEPFTSEDAVVAALGDCDGILAMRERTSFTESLLDRLPRLKFFNMTGRRARGLDAMAARGITVTITGGGEHGEDTAEHTLALILSSARHIPEADRRIRDGGFQAGVQPGMRLVGKTLGLLGFGVIGRRVATYARAFGMDVIAWSRSLTPGSSPADGVRAVAFEDLFSRSDILSVHLVLSPQTRGLVGAGEIGAMKPGALLVNTSRAPIVEEAPLLDALRDGRIRAALDVYPEEPIPGDHPLRRLPGTVLTPHLGYCTWENYADFYRASVENAIAFLDGAPIRAYAPELHNV